MSKKTAVKKTPGQKRKKIAGERSTTFFEKGKTRNRVRLFPSPAGYRVSVTRRLDGKPTDRSVEEFADLDSARDHIAEITERAVKDGWVPSFGVRGNNAALFQ